MSVFQIPPKTAFVRVSVHIEFIGSSAVCETSRPSTTAQSFDDTVTRHPDQASSEPYPPTEKTPGSNPGGAVFAAGSWVETVHTIPSTISISSGGRSKPKSKSKSDADADADDGSNKSEFSYDAQLVWSNKLSAL